ncbi:hypothetical protein PMV_359 [Port-miou virus]|uniref:Uncharacterized protein n=1 Tax=Port-miou virus TaxID=1733873 RepID=A0A0N9PWL7_9VIRU|nr:hypothetical protein PMV_359 [Port-miou virus]
MSLQCASKNEHFHIYLFCPFLLFLLFEGLLKLQNFFVVFFLEDGFALFEKEKRSFVKLPMSAFLYSPLSSWSKSSQRKETMQCLLFFSLFKTWSSQQSLIYRNNSRPILPQHKKYFAKYF